ncbi:MAG: Uma2 family endonuclease [Desulfobacteraceae bacterium]|nr:Uma2 family endonuclease [Desulfobacteraceae bacterium]
MLAEIQRKKFSTTEYHRMAETGIFKEDERLELIEGVIINIAPVGSRHAACVARLNQLFVIGIGEKAIVRIRGPFTIGEFSEPEPDILLLESRNDFYSKAHPGPEHVFLVVEVSDTTLDYDRNFKIPLYARAGIREAWIVNLQETYIEVYSTPSKQGYKMLRKYYEGDILTVSSFPDMNIAVDELLADQFE